MKEEQIEADILSYLYNQWYITAEKNITEWWYDKKRWFYRKNKSNFTKRWRADIQVLINWKLVVIEVKKPSEMKFFQKSLKDLQERYIDAQIRWIKSVKRYLHAVEQKQYINNIRKAWWYGFFASSVKEVEEWLKLLGIT